jgi:hypothetical protein
LFLGAITMFSWRFDADRVTSAKGIQKLDLTVRHTYEWTDGQTDGHTDWQKDGWMDGEAGGKMIERLTGRQADRQT